MFSTADLLQLRLRLLLRKITVKMLVYILHQHHRHWTEQLKSPQTRRCATEDSFIINDDQGPGGLKRLQKVLERT